MWQIETLHRCCGQRWKRENEPCCGVRTPCLKAGAAPFFVFWCSFTVCPSALHSHPSPPGHFYPNDTEGWSRETCPFRESTIRTFRTLRTIVRSAEVRGEVRWSGVTRNYRSLQYFKPANIGLISFIHFGRIISELGTISVSPAY
jgi:hypothetical protein